LNRLVTYYHGIKTRTIQTEKGKFMSKLLYIQASPRGQRSHSVTVTDAFIDAYEKKHPDDEVEILNVFDESLPNFDELTVQAKYTILHGKSHSQIEQDLWKNIEKVIEQFTSVDKYVLATPMWNFGIPYRLKQYIDILFSPAIHSVTALKADTRVLLKVKQC